MNNCTVISYFCLSYRRQIGAISCHNFNNSLEKWFPSRDCGPLVIYSHPQNHQCPRLQVHKDKIWRLTIVHCFNFLNYYWLGKIFLSIIFFRKTYCFCSHLGMTLSLIYSMSLRKCFFLSFLRNRLLQMAFRKFRNKTSFSRVTNALPGENRLYFALST